MYAEFKQICEEIDKVRASGAIAATVIMVYVAIDAMAFLFMSEEEDKNTSKDFIS